MREMNVCQCIGKSEITSKKNGKKYNISYCTYDLENKSNGQGCFSVFDDLKIGERYNFIFESGKAIVL